MKNYINNLIGEMEKIAERRVFRYIRNAKMLPESRDRFTVNGGYTLIVNYQGGYSEKFYLFVDSEGNGCLDVCENTDLVGGWNIENGKILW